jgi:hypothetical protein
MATNKSSFQIAWMQNYWYFPTVFRDAKYSGAATIQSFFDRTVGKSLVWIDIHAYCENGSQKTEP